MIILRSRGSVTSIAFVDVLLNMIIGLSFMFALAIIFMNPVAKREVLDPKAEYLVISSWDGTSPNDIDLWIKDDRGHIVSFRAKDLALMNLDRDDQGTRNDVLGFEGDGASAEPLEIRNINREVLSIRSKSPRTFVVTVHFFSYGVPQKILEKITVELIKVNPYKIVAVKEIVLGPVGQELHVFSFRVLENGSVEMIESSERILNEIAPMNQKENSNT